MPWIRIDDHFDEHPKHAAIGPVGWGVWLAGLAYCNRNLTDGFIPYSVAEAIGGAWKVRVPARDDEPEGDGVRTIKRRSAIWTIDIGSGMHGEHISTEWVIDLLLTHNLWEEVEGGYLIHDYNEYQPTKAQVQEERRKKQAAGQAGGKASAQARGSAGAQANLKPVPKPVPNSPKSVPGASIEENDDDGLSPTLKVLRAQGRLSA